MLRGGGMGVKSDLGQREFVVGWGKDESLCTFMF